MLEDVRDCAAFILHVTSGKTLDDYRADRLLRQGVERNFEIIGEAVVRIARDDAETAAKLGPHRQIIAFRNLLIHGYDVIDDAKVWQVIANDLSILEREATALLAAAPTNDQHSLGAVQDSDNEATTT